MSINYERLTWYARRLAAMGPLEIAHRVTETAKRRRWRHDMRGWSAFEVGDGHLVPIQQIRDRFCIGWTRELAASIEFAVSRVRAGTFSGLGVEWPKINSGSASKLGRLWLVDPISGKSWPGRDTFCFDVSYRHERHRGDIKYVWELNCLQFLHPVIALIARDRNEGLQNWAFDVIRGWSGENPPFRGPNWVSGIELALRLVSVALLVSAIPEGDIGSHDRRLIRQLVAAHGYWLERYPSRFSSANNHLIAEGLGLFLAGLLVPDLSRARAWVGHGRKVLEKEAERQIFDDGVGAEQSPTYTAFSVEMLVFAQLVGRAYGLPLAPVVDERLAAVASCLKTFMDEGASVPRIGDDDEARVLAQPPDREPRYVASVVAAVAGLLERSDLAPPSRDFHLRDLLFRSPSSGPRVANGVHVFRSGGYTVIRERVGGYQLVLSLDHGPLGYLSIAAHGHADTLAIWLHVDDVPILVDAGTYLYHSGGKWRDAFRGTAVHNTVCVAGENSSQIGGPFMWSRKAVGQLVGCTDGSAWKIVARHDGYRARFGVEHERAIARTPEGVAIRDRLLGRDKQPATLSFLFNPKLKLKLEGDRLDVTRDGKKLLSFRGDPRLTMQIISGDDDRRLGWISQHFGARQAAPLLIMEGYVGGSPVETNIIL